MLLAVFLEPKFVHKEDLVIFQAVPVYIRFLFISPLPINPGGLQRLVILKMFVRNALVVTGLLAALTQAAPAEKKASGHKLTVYWGAEDDTTTLDDVCNDSSYDVVNLAFLSHFFSDGSYPKMSIGNLDGPSRAQKKAGATGLQDGSSLVRSIKNCQNKGKPVILSMGGATDYSDVQLHSDTQGQQIANTVWNLFLGGTDHKELRPFGDVKLDGVDLDNETNDGTGYLAMTKQFKANFQKDTSKKYYITAAPQCPYPDQSEPLDVCRLLDWVQVQFYNNGNCNIAQSGFANAVESWSRGIGSGVQLYIGALASGADGDEGYVDAAALNEAIDQVKAMDLPNFGGAMLWEAQLAVRNGNYQKKIKANL
ncbi:chitinase CHIT30 [Metarhizium guizhouense ARSEF 977]|uniref:chitinase n=1 Tax=Metarhizium guizhouense (strain ARSEF 977) TaxID=1276136 RepID=A0A0B4GS97_METGA|nr:chitinase CHIT30 [Metarhizium guizhouense ARSEF 977]